MKFPKIFHLTLVFISWIEVFNKAGSEGPLELLWAGEPMIMTLGRVGIASLTPV